MPDTTTQGYTPSQTSRLQRERNRNTVRISRTVNGYLVTEMGTGKTFAYQDRGNDNAESRAEMLAHIVTFFNTVEAS